MSFRGVPGVGFGWRSFALARLRRIAGPLICVALTAFGVGWLPASAEAAGNIAITSFKISGCFLEFTFDDGNGLQLTSEVVHVYSGTTDVADINGLVYEGGPPSQQNWFSAEYPFPATSLQPGNYTVTVDATDADESDPGLPSPQPLPIVYNTRISISSATPTTLSYGHTTMTVSGVVTATKTCDETGVYQMSGLPVDLTDEYTHVTTPITTTQPDGTYSAQVPLTTMGDPYGLTVPSGATWVGSTGSLGYSWVRSGTRLVSVQATPQDASYDATVTLTGTAEYDDSSTGWQPLTNFPVAVQAGSSTATVTTNSAGQFTWPHPASDGPAWAVLVKQNLPWGNRLLGNASASGSIHVAAPVRFKRIQWNLGRNALINAGACVQVVPAGFPAPTGSVEIQYSARRAGPWRNLGRIFRANMWAASSRCAAKGEAFYLGRTPVRLASAYYRAYIPATADNQAEASPPVLRWRYATRIVGIQVSPHSVQRGGNLTVSGRLQTFNRHWRNFAGRQILIVLKPAGTKTWYWIVKARTNSAGHFTKTFKDPTSATWSAVYEGNTTHFACGGAEYYVPLSGASRAVLLPSAGSIRTRDGVYTPWEAVVAAGGGDALSVSRHRS